jgi:hypothetical protein
MTVCRGCQQNIKFKALNLDGTPHTCNGAIKQDIQRKITCNYCGVEIMFNNDVRSPSGKKIPLLVDGSLHDCPKHPYHQNNNQAAGYEYAASENSTS